MFDKEIVLRNFSSNILAVSLFSESDLFIVKPCGEANLVGDVCELSIGLEIYALR